MIQDSNKFEFTPEFQHDILRFIVTDSKDGYKLMTMLDDTYFTLMEDALIMQGIHRYYKSEGRIPSKTMLVEELKQYVLKQRDVITNITEEDVEEIVDRAKKLYSRTVRDGDVLFRKTVEFIRFIQVTNVIETENLNDTKNYIPFMTKLSEAMKIDILDDNKYGSNLVTGFHKRQIQRRESNGVIPTPFHQLNRLTNAGGIDKGSTIVILDKPKKFKTGALINWAIAILKKKKSVLYIDLENGEDSILTRSDQSVGNTDKKTILSGKEDKKLAKTFRRYKRLGVEMKVIRLPAMLTTPAKLSQLMHDIYRDEGIRFNNLVIDYAALMGSNVRTDDDNTRISNIFLELGNVATEHDLDYILTAHHVKRSDAVTRRERTKYISEDIAKCIDIVRHVHMVLGLNRTEEEEREGYQRMEIVEQRDGKPFGRAVFRVNKDNQRMVELTRDELNEYEDLFFGEDEDLGDTGLEEVSTGRTIRNMSDA